MPSGVLEGAVNLAGTRSHVFNVGFRVTGSGSFNIYIDDVLYGSYGYAAGAQEVKVVTSTDSFALKFEYVPGDGDEGMAVVYSARVVSGMTIAIR